MSSTRVVVIGAGWAGLAAAKTYLQINPTVQLTIFDANKTIGGVWSKDRVYPGLTVDSPSGFFDFSDLPMPGKVGTKLTAMQVHDYLCEYADRFHLTERIRFGMRVVKCTQEHGEWVVHLDIGEEVICDKLIIASGLASDPYMPDIPHTNFTGPVIHSVDVAPYFDTFTRPGMRSVAVYGGCKSAIDAIIMCLEAGKEVDWVIRDVGQGNGPGVLLELPKPIFGLSPALIAGRWKNVWTPSIFSTEGWWWRFLHSGKNSFGMWLNKKIWKKISATSLSREPYKTGSENVKKLSPENDNLLWFAAGVAALHDNKTFTDNLHEGKRLRVHRATITSMTKDTVQLSNNTTINNVDGAIFATGWKPNTNIFYPPLSSLPIPLSSEDEESKEYWDRLNAEADREVIQRLPLLAESPQSTTYQRPLSHTPFRLYRYIIPTTPDILAARSLICVGLLTITQTTIYDEVSALWGISWMEGLRDVPSKEDMDKDIALVNAWCARRYLGRGKARPIAAAEVQDVTDVMMRDLGLREKRKSGWLSDWFLMYRAKDYRGMVEDFLKGRVSSQI